MPQLKPEAPEVRCKLQAAPAVPREPAADQWLEWTPSTTGSGSARLSEKAVTWVIEVLGVVRVSEGLRAAEHACLDNHEAKGLIRQ